jgi:hypothetical protein
MGEQVIPIGMATPWAEMPKRPNSLEIAGVTVLEVLSQHWRAPVSQELAGTALGAGVATARTAREEMAASLLNMFRS